MKIDFKEITYGDVKYEVLLNSNYILGREWGQLILQLFFRN
jgi:hypothetical protein